MKDTGRMICKMAKAWKAGRMAVGTKVAIKKA